MPLSASASAISCSAPTSPASRRLCVCLGARGGVGGGQARWAWCGHTVGAAADERQPHNRQLGKGLGSGVCLGVRVSEALDAAVC
jgi:hypothetical protein